MISLNILETKTFMTSIFKTTMFDEWEGRQVEISTYTKFLIDCKVNKNFYSTDEFESLANKTYVLWTQLKNSILQLIKGNKTPSYMKIVLLMPLDKIVDVDTNNIDGLFINITFENSGVTITTGTSQKTFTLDKSTDHYWDNYVMGFLNENGIIYEKKN